MIETHTFCPSRNSSQNNLTVFDTFWSLNKSARTEKLNLGYKWTTATRSLTFKVISTALQTTFSNFFFTFSEKDLHCI